MKPARSLLISCLLVIAISHPVAASNHQRQLLGPTTPTSTPTPSNPASGTGTGTGTGTSSSPENTSKTTSSLSTSNTSETTSSTPPSVTSTPPTSTLPPPTSTPPATSQSTTTDASGSTVIITVTSSSSSSASATSTTSKPADNPGGGLGTGSIVGIAVSGGIAVIAIIAFLVWKFTRKRFSDFDDNEAIKWPELNTHGGNVDSHPLPVNNTGRSGFDTGSEVSLSRIPSSSNYSTPDILGGGPDPYAVPPLPHMNPNQPYRDDPTATSSGYYDPYRGPIPGTLEHGAGADDWAGEAIPMTQMAGRMSPGPHAAYGGEHDIGRQSPGPQAAYGMGRTTSPGPQAAYAGRSSPGPQAAYGGRASPGPQAAYSAGRMSPGAQASYDQYGGR